MALKSYFPLEKDKVYLFISTDTVGVLTRPLVNGNPNPDDLIITGEDRINAGVVKMHPEQAERVVYTCLKARDTNRKVELSFNNHVIYFE